VLWQEFQQNGLNQENKSVMKLLTACPICKGEQIGPYAMKYQKDFPHNSRTICKSCGIVFANPVADEQELNAFYKNYYDKGNFGDLQYKQKTIQQFNTIQSSSKDGLLNIDKNIKYYSGNGQFLDVGFGLGVHLYMAQKLGYRVYGTELDSDCINFVAPYLPNAQLFSGDLLSANYENNYFDLINICHVIEHLIDPNSYLLELNRIVKNEGLIIVSTPNIGALAYQLFRIVNFLGFKIPLIVDGLEHTVIFNQKNLRTVIQNHGFVVVDQYTESVNDSFSNIWKSNLSLRKKVVRYLQTFVKINQVIVAKKVSAKL
jgi:2-polyprenyl-3-methyl-5-hydroxy-6-metoxy-1,4-benzoquinol methylase